MSEPRQIKKYPNRRLYDTRESRYITLADVRRLLRTGEDVQVLDSQSGEDITRSILIQIITEQEAGAEPLFTNETLTRFIRSYDDAIQGAFSSYMEQTMRLFSEQQKQMSGLFGTSANNDWAALAEKNMLLWRDMQESWMKAAGFSGASGKDKPEK
ncbi:MAG: polyhydroxyalkanoate synthesis repressor PhaR [Chromatiales bacterium]|jgi:polyhydroxyalkanoate synthesis repressor PhaR|nr:polyhydroxyalkanoate synthesis repressor PhaR [Chromatiales bacterium]MDX9767304.1 polyhydroxyalkanoate synthesis repressor PhaR [Ectothiorhodospiraceae bacterium]